MKVAFFFILVLTSAPVIFAQTGDVQQNFVRVSVFDNDGRYVSGIKPEHITLKEGKETKPVLRFQSEETAPVAVAIVISESYLRPVAAQAALRFIQKANAANDYCIIGYDKTVELLADWKSADDTLVASLNKIAASTNKTKDFMAFDALSLGLEKLKQSPLKKKALLIFGTLGTLEDAGSKISFDNLKALAVKSDAEIYAVRFYDWDGSVSGNKSIGKLTETSGGMFIDLYVDPGTERVRREPIGPGLTVTEIRPKLSGTRNTEKDISELGDLLVQNVEKTYLLAYEKKTPAAEKMEIKVSLPGTNGKRINFKTRFRKLSE